MGSKVFPESASEGFLFSTPSPGVVDRAVLRVPGNRKTNKKHRFFNGLSQAEPAGPNQPGGA